MERHPPALSPGSLLGPYEIRRLVGAGGMGEVYEAMDPRLGRRVAIKVLPQSLALDGDRLRRFEQEAKAAGALNHPSVLSVYDFGDQSGFPFLVTELLEGNTLRSRLRRGPLSQRRSVELARQVAEGLAAAHDHGIVHRDLKPENLFLTSAGRIKILDFGLAKLTRPWSEGHSASAATRSGTVAGTSAYMSPEQVSGEPADARSDLFALGAILYEMLTGEAAFGRGALVQTLNAILEEDPPLLGTLHTAMPEALGALISHCLEKDPSRRYRSAHDLALALASLSATAMPNGAAPRLPRRPRWRTVPLRGIGMAALFLVLGWGLATMVQRAPPSSVPLELQHLTRSRNDYSPSASPDGRTVAFVSARDGRPRIWLKELAGGGETPLTEGPDLFPRFAPDGASLLFVRVSGSQRALTKIPFPGGEPRILLRDVFDADWSPSGQQIAFVRHESLAASTTTTLALLDPISGESRSLARFEDRRLYQPRWSPDGSRLALVPAGGNSIFIVGVADGVVEELAPPPPERSISTAVWEDSSHLVYLKARGKYPGVAISAGQCLRQNVDTGRSEVLFWTPNWGQHVDLVAGDVVFSAGSSRQNLWQVGVTPEGASDAGRWITGGASIDREPIYSPDGDWIAFSSDRSGNLDLWRADTGDLSLQRLTDHSAEDISPAFSADGNKIFWSSNRSGSFQLWTANADGSGASRLVATDFPAHTPTPAPDGEWVIFESDFNGLWRVRPDGSGLEQLLAGRVALPALSRDGLRLSFLSFAEEDPALVTLRALRLPGADVEPWSISLAPHSPTELLVPGRAGWWPGYGILAYLDRAPSGRLGVFFVDPETSDRQPRPLIGFEPGLLPETFAFSPDGGSLVLSRLELQQNLMLARQPAESP